MQGLHRKLFWTLFALIFGLEITEDFFLMKTKYNKKFILYFIYFRPYYCESSTDRENKKVAHLHDDVTTNCGTRNPVTCSPEVGLLNYFTEKANIAVPLSWVPGRSHVDGHGGFSHLLRQKHSRAFGTVALLEETCEARVKSQTEADSVQLWWVEQRLEISTNWLEAVVFKLVLVSVPGWCLLPSSEVVHPFNCIWFLHFA